MNRFFVEITGELKAMNEAMNFMKKENVQYKIEYKEFVITMKEFISNVIILLLYKNINYIFHQYISNSNEFHLKAYNYIF